MENRKTTIMSSRYFAFVHHRSTHLPPVCHFVGLPPELTPDKREPVPFPYPDVIVITPASDVGVMLDRYTVWRDIAGDTWHESLAEAKQCAIEEYGDALSEWMEVPHDVEDAVSHALSQQERLSELSRHEVDS
jgi:hypothetical protein